MCIRDRRPIQPGHYHLQRNVKPLRTVRHPHQQVKMVVHQAKGQDLHPMHPITNAAAEGINSVIQSLKHASRGLPRFESLRIRVLIYLGKLDLKPA